MAVRKDQVQIDITFLTDENRQFAKLNQANKQLIRDLRKTKKEGGDLAGVVQNIARQAGQVEKIDLGKVAPAELIARARQLRTVLQQIPESAPGAAKLRMEYKRINDRLAEIRQSTRGVVAESGKMGKVLQGALSVFGGISLAGIASSIVGLGKSIFQAGTNFQKFEAVLTNTLGSRSEANRVLKNLQDFAAQTPFQLEELTQSYIKLVNRGIKPSQEELTLLGDIAASQGKSFDQLAEAVLDATTGEFERLKEFGIRAKKDGDTVQLAFKGMTKEVANTEEAIAQAILDFGQLEGVVGSMAAIAQTRGGQVSNFFDNLNKLFTNLSEGYVGRIFDLALGGINKLVGGLVKLTDKQTKASDSVEELQFQFNAQIETLKRGNLSQENRAKLIDQINQRYGDYLPNLLSEASTLQDIADAQDAANKSFQQRILILSAQEALQETNKALLESTREQLRLEERLSIQQAKLAQAREEDAERARRGLPGASGVGAGRSQNQVQAEINRINAAIVEQANLQQRLQAEFEASIAAANRLGVDIEAALTGEVAGSGGSGGGSLGEQGLETRLKGIEAFFARQRLLVERALLEREIDESEHNKRLLELEQERYTQQLQAFDLYNESQSERAEQARNELIKIQQRFTSPTAVATLPGTGTPDGVERRGIDAGLDAQAKLEESQLDRLRRAFNQALITENEYALAKLQLRRDTLAAEIELLRQGTEAEVQEAARRAEQLIAIDEQLAAKRREIDQAEEQFKIAKFEAINNLFANSIDFAAELLSQDEKARKKHATVLKAFQAGQIIAAGITEIQKIWANAPEAGLFASPVIGGIQTAAAAVRTATALARLRKTEFKAADGIAIGEFGGKLHSQGGTKGYFDDGTSVEVEKGEKFVVLNRNSSAMLQALSDLNVAGGGRSLLGAARAGLRFNTGGVVPLNTTPLSSTANLQPGGSNDTGALLNEFRNVADLLRMWPQRIRAEVTYTDLETASSDVRSVRAAASV
jgi:hypothetical protein